MSQQSYTIFNFNNLVYGIKTIFVEQMFYLPEVTPVPESPPDIIGVVNVHGNIIPIMDLNLRFGYPSSGDYRLSDSIIIVNFNNLQVGIIVNDINQIINISPEEITVKASYEKTLIKDQEERFIDEIATKKEQLILLLNLEKILNYVESQDLKIEQDSLKQNNYNLYTKDNFFMPEDNENHNKSSIFCPNATIYERDILQQRAIDLSKVVRNKKKKQTRALAVIILNNELFGIDLELIREFTQISKVTPIPCTPKHLVGNCNLRGEILTVIAIRGFLNLPLKVFNNNSQIMIVEIQGIKLGITIDDVYDVIFLNPKKILSNTNKFSTINHDYLEPTFRTS
ncbi:MAG TPA: chemotaxis protein CheW, partial [Cyanothece sp. UBA12306]|nr:chemotaxis protein CheW [Cyanothece sp. UBA12306]